MAGRAQQADEVVWKWVWGTTVSSEKGCPTRRSVVYPPDDIAIKPSVGDAVVVELVYTDAVENEPVSVAAMI